MPSYRLHHPFTRKPLSVCKILAFQIDQARHKSLHREKLRHCQESRPDLCQTPPFLTFNGESNFATQKGQAGRQVFGKMMSALRRTEEIEKRRNKTGANKPTADEGNTASCFRRFVFLGERYVT